VREAELRDAAGLLGAEVTLLDYEDQKLCDAPTEQIRAELVSAIRKLKPEVVVTFDPNGFNRHPDHVAISRFTMDAVAAAADARWVPETGDPHEVKRVVWPCPVPAFELGYTEALERQPGVDFLIDTQPFWKVKEAALRAHRTQMPGLRKLFFEKPDVARTLSVEAFRLGWSIAASRRPARDLFDGL
jgi:LmbE family N-acetylglucosaminyl deacetylase